MKSDILCIYHGNCADGFGAAWTVRKALGEDRVDFFAGYYGKEPPDVNGRDVIIVDFSYKEHVLKQMALDANSILVLDHHKSAAEDLRHIPPPPNGRYTPDSVDWCAWTEAEDDPSWALFALFDMERSGAGLTWDFFFPGEPRPPLIAHIEDRDLWRFDLEGTREIQAAVFSYPYDFTVWDDLMQRPTAELFAEGEGIMRKQMKDIKEFIAVAGRRLTINGHDVPALNCPYFWSSEAGNIMAKGEPFAACYWDQEDGRVFSLRSTDAGQDVQAIAVQFGGGGHRNAAGFKMPIGWEGDKQGDT